MNKGDLIVFDSKKNFKYIKSLGAGGTGDTHLFLDETTGIPFAIKKWLTSLSDVCYTVRQFEIGRRLTCVNLCTLISNKK